MENSFTINTGSYTDTPDSHLRRYLSWVLLLSAFPLLGYYAVREFLFGSALVLALVLAMLAANIASYILFKRAGHPENEKRIYTGLVHTFLFFFAALLVYRIGLSAKYSRLPWVYVFVLAAFFLTRPKTGLVWCLSLFAALLLTGNRDPGTPLIQRIHLTLGVVTLIAFFAKKTTADYRREMIRNLTGLKQAETRHRITANRLTEEIAQRETNEKQLDALMVNLDIGVYRRSAEPDGKFLNANPALLEMLGFTTKETLLASDFSASFVDPRVQTRLYEQVMARGVIKNVEVALQRENNTAFTAAISAVASGGGKGRPRYIDGVVEDISYRKSLEEQIRQSQKMDALGTLAGGIAHDFNNILGAIIGFSELAAVKLPSGSPVHDDLAQILAASHRAKDLVGQILAFSRQSRIENRPIQIEPVVKEILKLLRSTFPSSIRIRHHMDPHLGYVQGDPTQIHQIILNLCTNAEHAMRRSGGTLGIIVRETDLYRETESRPPALKPGRYLKITVEDTGSGISPEIRASIFDPYFTTKDIGEGTGMGLAVVMGIVKGLGGDISVESIEGKGSTFSVHLPVIQPPRPQPGSTAKNAPPHGQGRILLVDDEPALASLGKKSLENLGYSVKTKTDPAEALALFQRDPAHFDLVITDMTMPGMTGDRLATALMEIRPELPVILSTGFSQIISEARAREIGIRAFIQKPIPTADLADTVRRVLTTPP